MDQFVELKTFDEFLKTSKKNPRILLSVYREDCEQCLSEEAEYAIVAKYKHRLQMLKMNADQVPELESKLKIDLIPTLSLRTGETERRFSAIPDVNGKNVLHWLAAKIRS